MAGLDLHILTPVRTTLAFRKHSGNQRAAGSSAILRTARHTKRATSQRRTAPGMSKNRSSTATPSIFGSQPPFTQYQTALRQQHRSPSPQDNPASVNFSSRQRAVRMVQSSRLRWLPSIPALSAPMGGSRRGLELVCHIYICLLSLPQGSPSVLGKCSAEYTTWPITKCSRGAPAVRAGRALEAGEAVCSLQLQCDRTPANFCLGTALLQSRLADARVRAVQPAAKRLGQRVLRI